jgi:hypothetical protein
MEWPSVLLSMRELQFEVSQHKVVYDPSDPVIDEAQFEAKDWASSEFLPEPRGQTLVIGAKVDADHASDSVTRRSRNGFLVWINSCLVYFLSKKQTSVETSSFGSEFVAMKQYYL